MTIDSEQSSPKEEYIVYRCEKCKQYTYAKASQQAKKCPRCHHSMPIAEAIEVLKTKMDGTIVRGVTAANTQVRVKQTLLHGVPKEFASSAGAIKVSGGTGGFVSQANTGGVRSPVKKPNPNSEDDAPKGEKYGSEYLQLLGKIKQWQRSNSIQPNTGFPIYMLDMIIGELGIPDSAATYLKYKLNKHFGFRIINKEYCYLN